MELVLLNAPLMNRKPHLGYFVPELGRKLQYNVSFGLQRLLQVVTVEVYPEGCWQALSRQSWARGLQTWLPLSFAMK